MRQRSSPEWAKTRFAGCGRGNDWSGPGRRAAPSDQQRSLLCCTTTGGTPFRKAVGICSSLPASSLLPGEGEMSVAFDLWQKLPEGFLKKKYSAWCRLDCEVQSLIFELANDQNFRCAFCSRDQNLIIEHDHNPSRVVGTNPPSTTLGAWPVTVVTGTSDYTRRILVHARHSRLLSTSVAIPRLLRRLSRPLQCPWMMEKCDDASTSIHYARRAWVTGEHRSVRR